MRRTVAARLPVAVSALVLLAVAVMPVAGKKAVQAPHYLKPDALDWAKLLEPGPPAAGSAEAKADLAVDLHWQEVRTDADVARCKQEDVLPPWIFAEVLGPTFTHKNYPAVDQLLRRAEQDALYFADTAKERWDRARPSVVDPSIHPVVGKQTNGWFPSSHATRGMLWGTLLAELYPAHAEALLAEGKRIGDDRVIAGIHFPTDVVAGQKLGTALARTLLANPSFQADLQTARAEVAAATTQPVAP